MRWLGVVVLFFCGRCSSWLVLLFCRRRARVVSLRRSLGRLSLALVRCARSCRFVWLVVLPVAAFGSRCSARLGGLRSLLCLVFGRCVGRVSAGLVRLLRLLCFVLVLRWFRCLFLGVLLWFCLVVLAVVVVGRPALGRCLLLVFGFVGFAADSAVFVLGVGFGRRFFFMLWGS